MDLTVSSIGCQRYPRAPRAFGIGPVLLSRLCVAILGVALPLAGLSAADAQTGPRIEVSTGEPGGGPLHVIGTEGVASWSSPRSRRDLPTSVT
jgi:hypothetical protein